MVVNDFLDRNDGGRHKKKTAVGEESGTNENKNRKRRVIARKPWRVEKRQGRRNRVAMMAAEDERTTYQKGIRRGEPEKKKERRSQKDGFKEGGSSQPRFDQVSSHKGEQEKKASST